MTPPERKSILLTQKMATGDRQHQVISLLLLTGCGFKVEEVS